MQLQNPQIMQRSFSVMFADADENDEADDYGGAGMEMMALTHLCIYFRR